MLSLRDKINLIVMFKSKFIYLLMVLAVTFVSLSCRRGEGDPAISLRSRKARLTGEWKLKKGNYTYTYTYSFGQFQSTTTDILNLSDGIFTYTSTSGNSTSTKTGTYSRKITINKDGSWNEEYIRTETGSTTETYKREGKWNWTGGVGDMKSKSQIVLTVLKEMEISGNSTYFTNYTGIEAPHEIWDIYQLKNKEMIVKGSGTYTSSGGSNSTSSFELTFVQD